MVKSTDNRLPLSVPPFLMKCYEMVDDQTTNSIISWNDFNNSFAIWDAAEFSVRLLPKYFKHNNFSSFMRQLNIYGFRKTDTDHWEFANDGFIRGQKHLLMNICRKKHSKGQDLRKLSQQDNSVDLCQNVENLALQKEVESLKTGKNVLIKEFVKLRKHQETAENKLLLLRERLQGMEKSQQQMLSFLVMAMQNPGILVQLIHPKENNWHVAESSNNMLEQGTQDADPVFSDMMVVKYQPPVDGTPMPGPSPASEKLMESDTPCENDIFVNLDFIKLLMDEKVCPLESPAPITLPEIDDGVWEQLFTSRFLQDGVHAEQDNQQPFDSGMEIESEVSGTQLGKSQNFEGLVKEMEKSQNFMMD